MPPGGAFLGFWAPQPSPAVPEGPVVAPMGEGLRGAGWMEGAVGWWVLWGGGVLWGVLGRVLRPPHLPLQKGAASGSPSSQRLPHSLAAASLGHPHISSTKSPALRTDKPQKHPLCVLWGAADLDAPTVSCSSCLVPARRGGCLQSASPGLERNSSGAGSHSFLASFSSIFQAVTAWQVCSCGVRI